MYPNTSKPRLRKRNQRIKKERRSKELTYYCDLTKEMIQNHYLSWLTSSATIHNINLNKATQPISFN